MRNSPEILSLSVKCCRSRRRRTRCDFWDDLTFSSLLFSSLSLHIHFESDASMMHQRIKGKTCSSYILDYVAASWYRAPELCGSFYSKMLHLFSLYHLLVGVLVRTNFWWIWICTCSTHQQLTYAVHVSPSRRWNLSLRKERSVKRKLESSYLGRYLSSIPSCYMIT